MPVEIQNMHTEVRLDRRSKGGPTASRRVGASPSHGSPATRQRSMEAAADEALRRMLRRTA